MLNIPSLLLLAAGLASPAPALARTASSQDIEMKVSLESLMEKRLETVLRKVLATDDVSVIVNAELLADAARPDIEVLPGVTVKKVPSATAPMEMPASLVKRITITVFVPLSTSEPNRALASETVKRLVGYKEERGDVVSVETLATPAPATSTAPATAAAAATHPAGAAEPSPRLARFLDQALQPAVLLLLGLLLTAVAGLVLVARRFFDPLVGVLREAAQNLNRAAADGTKAGAEEREEEAETAAATTALQLANGTEPSDRRLPFSSVRERDLPALEMLLQDQNEAASAVVVQYLPPGLATRVLASMPAPKRETVLSYMSSPALLDQSDVQRIEDSILSRLDYILGGEDKLVSIIDQAPMAMQTEILEIMKRRNPDLERRLEHRVILLDDIALLDETDLTALNRTANVRGMAVVLKYMPHLRDVVLPKLKGGLGEWLTQETELIGDLSEQVKDAEMRRVHQAFVRLVREGKIVLKKGSPPPAAAEPQAAQARVLQAPTPQEPQQLPGPAVIEAAVETGGESSAGEAVETGGAAAPNGAAETVGDAEAEGGRAEDAGTSGGDLDAEGGSSALGGAN